MDDSTLRLAHVPRRFFDAQSAAPVAASRAMDFILDVYRVERAALDADLLGTPEHLEMHQTARRYERGDQLRARAVGGVQTRTND